MEELLANSSFKIYAAVSALLALKMLLLAFIVPGIRTVKKKYPNPEDQKLFKAEAGEDPFAERVNRAHRNAMENELLFMILGLLYVLLGAPTGALQIYAYTFFIVRVLHSVFYLAKLQPFRSLAWVVCWLCLVGMCVQILMAAFGM
jgi:uncharacterized MAPEG superfamily protein